MMCSGTVRKSKNYYSTVYTVISRKEKITGIRGDFIIYLRKKVLFRYRHTPIYEIGATQFSVSIS